MRNKLIRLLLVVVMFVFAGAAYIQCSAPLGYVDYQPTILEHHEGAHPYDD